jgi:hypothetical protein
MKNAVFWDVALRRSCENRYLGTANATPRLRIISTLKMEEAHSPKPMFPQDLYIATVQKAAILILYSICSLVGD